MTTKSSSNSFAVSPISQIPYDVLGEIFTHCLPTHRLEDRQPNTMIAPMLLCQICSAWRTITLKSPLLWSHLSYCLLIAEIEPDKGFGRELKICKDQWAFIAWWRRNQGTTAPFLCLDSEVSHPNNEASEYQELWLDGAKLTSFFKYMTSAQYFEATDDIWQLLYEWNRDERPDSHVYPNPHTLVRDGCCGKSDDFFYRVQALIPNRATSALRSLSLSYDELHDDFLVPHHWSRLTHITFDLELPLNVWFSFIRSVPDLQWGHFNVLLSYSYEEYAEPTKYALRSLSTFCIRLCGNQRSWAADSEFSLSTLFTNLRLPVLHTLSLSSIQDTWFDHHAVAELYTVLDSTPAITTLTLGRFSLASDYYSMEILPTIGDVEPVWCRAPLLQHLRLGLPGSEGLNKAELKKTRNTFVRNVLRCDNHWLSLDNPSCTIRKITVIDGALSDRWADDIKSYTMSRVQTHAKKAPNANVVFDVISDSENLDGMESYRHLEER